MKLCMYCLFFFKQKAAYEMRISDWSSDVCSSDLNSLEGKRATPRAKPPFPQVSGLFGKPTIVNNVETCSCVPHIIDKGADWFRGLSKNPQDGGTKLYVVSGKVNTPGAWELPMGVTLSEDRKSKRLNTSHY